MLSSASSTVGNLLHAAGQRLTESGSESPRLDAELLLGHVLGVGRATLLAEPESTVSPAQSAAFTALIERRAKGEPVSYIRGLKEFYGLVLSVDERALIPRPETETLVELALERVATALTGAPRQAGANPLLVWDVGTGSGAICVALAVECRRRGYGRDLRFLATDVSADALGLATENAVAHGVADTISFAKAELTDLPTTDFVPADLLLANLPYIPSAVVPQLPVAASFEPRGALDGGADGLALIQRLVGDLPRALALGGTALLEIGSDQSHAVVNFTPGGWTVVVHDDLSGRPRVAEFMRGGA
ncbi:MAG: peptide chain release factor N(5)-glutamine methyltransferase [Chloroflexota bacterium]